MKDCKNRETYSGDEYEHENIKPAKTEFDGNIELSKWNTIQLEAHERWSYDDESKTQKLERMIALCHRCHTATHLGLADLRGLKHLALKHMQKVNNWDDKHLEQHNDEQTTLYRKRSNVNWNLNLDIITDSGYHLIK